ncbi:MAG: antibiotic biosynthesis monooxygenase [Gammaproteobacteria bacterium]|nr:antibiotic biosynthesis monooxygenase [Gammaproteobacteria bacterium]MDG2337073.1 antibiotic biosynthesis monooxygenase [Gammaproteobacteria bacterium]
MIIVSGSIKFASVEELENAKQALKDRAARSREDAGCTDYVFSQNLEDPAQILLSEKWESDELLKAHLVIPDEEFGALMATAKIASAIVVSSESGEEHILMSDK